LKFRIQIFKTRSSHPAMNEANESSDNDEEDFPVIDERTISFFEKKNADFASINQLLHDDKASLEEEVDNDELLEESEDMPSYNDSEMVKESKLLVSDEKKMASQIISNDASSSLHNDDLYDPSLDDENEKWVKKRILEKDIPVKSSSSSIYSPSAPSIQTNPVSSGSLPVDDATSDAAADIDDVPVSLDTDAILSCPSCFTTICYQCQRHENYAGQFRAIDVFHCIIGDVSEIPLHRNLVCEQCKDKVGLWHEKDDIYYLFDVLESENT
jgi:E2F-associated phosphoprotein